MVLGMALHLVAIAQGYHRLIEPGKYWEILQCDRQLICNASSGYRQYFEGDTLIDGRLYAKMYAHQLISQWGTSPYCPPFGVSADRFLTEIFIREDTVAQRIYRRDPDGSDGESLVIDLNMQPGGTWEVEPGDIVLLDSITVSAAWDGIERRVFHFGSCQFVEGIGMVGSWDVFGPPSIHPPHCLNLYCFEHIGHSSGGCSGPLNIDDLAFGVPTIPYPNPASDEIRLPPMWDVPAQAYIHDQLGRLIMRFDVSKDGSVIDVRGLSPGTYELRAVAADGAVVTGRFEVLR